MAIPKKGEPGYDEYRAKYNAKRRERRADPDHWLKEREGMYRRRRERKARKEQGDES